MTQIIGLSMKDILRSSNLINTMSDAFKKNLGDIRNFFSQIVPSKTISMEKAKQEVWRDLSLVYYKYEDGTQKRVFREILSEISERIHEGNWDSVYRKLYRIESKPKTVRP